jgi:ribosome-associated toxin RatA of RatAB toxin-antitoxin module
MNKCGVLSVVLTMLAMIRIAARHPGTAARRVETMERSRLLTWTAFAVAVPLAVLPAAAQAGSPTISDDLRNGEIETTSQPHPGTTVQWGRAVVLIDAPVDAVMAVIQNYAGYKTFLPHFEESRVLSQRGASALVYVKVSVMHGAANLWAEVKLRPRAGEGATRVIEGAMTKGNMDHFEAVWEVTPVEGGTLVAFQILVDPDLPLPASLINNENQASARKALRALRTLLTEHKSPAKT